MCSPLILKWTFLIFWCRRQASTIWWPSGLCVQNTAGLLNWLTSAASIRHWCSDLCSVLWALSRLNMEHQDFPTAWEQAELIRSEGVGLLFLPVSVIVSLLTMLFFSPLNPTSLPSAHTLWVVQKQPYQLYLWCCSLLLWLCQSVFTVAAGRNVQWNSWHKSSYHVCTYIIRMN